MRRFAVLAALVGLAFSVSLFHHGHVMAFVQGVRELADERLGRRFRGRRWNVRASLAQLHFGDPAVHYEAWVQRKTRSVEIGLHFEGEREHNERWAELIAARQDEIRAELGASAELEHWTRRWWRLHETHRVGGEPWSPKRDLTDDVAKRIAERLCRYVEVVEPVLSKERKKRATSARR